MKVTIWDGREFEYKCADIRKMSKDELRDLLKDVIDEREGEPPMSDRGLMLDEVYLKIDNELHKSTLNNHFITSIIEGFDDFLEEKGVIIPNEERDPDCGSNIYGEDFDWMMEMIRDCCKNYGVIVEDNWKEQGK